MSGLNFDAPGDHHFVRSIGASGIQVAGEHYRQSLIISAELLITDWPPQSLGDLDEAHFEPLLELRADIVLLGTGRHQHLLHPSRLAAFHRIGTGVEVMTTEAACRTFNILVIEGRKVAAGLLPLDAD